VRGGATDGNFRSRVAFCGTPQRIHTLLLETGRAGVTSGARNCHQTRAHDASQRRRATLPRPRPRSPARVGVRRFDIATHFTTSVVTIPSKTFAAAQLDGDVQGNLIFIPRTTVHDSPELPRLRL
jgi:hypothetical protein